MTVVGPWISILCFSIVLIGANDGGKCGEYEGLRICRPGDSNWN